MSSELYCPKGWKIVQFGDVVRQVKKKVDPVAAELKRYVAGEHMDTDSLRIWRWGNVGDGYLGPAFTAHFLPGQVLYGSRRTYLRKVAVADFEGVCANTTFVLEPSTPELRADFLPYVMTVARFHEHSIKQSKGSVNPYINFRDLTWYEFALPPLDEQQQIVQEQQRVELCRDLAEESVQRLTGVACSLRAEMFTADCAVAPLADVSVIPSQNGLSVPKGDRGGPIPMINMGALFTDDIVVSGQGAEQVSLDPDVLVRYSLSQGDLLFARRSIVLEGAGRCVMVGPLARPSVFESSVIRVRVDDSVLRPAFLLHYFHSPRGRSQMKTIVRKGAVSGIAGSDLRKLQVPIPPVEIQDEFLLPCPSIDEMLSRLIDHRDSYGPLQRALRQTRLDGSANGVH